MPTPLGAKCAKGSVDVFKQKFITSSSKPVKLAIAKIAVFFNAFRERFWMNRNKGLKFLKQRAETKFIIS